MAVTLSGGMSRLTTPATSEIPKLATDAEFIEAINRSDSLELVTADELRELFVDRWTLTEGGDS